MYILGIMDNGDPLGTDLQTLATVLATSPATTMLHAGADTIQSLETLQSLAEQVNATARVVQVRDGSE